MPVVRACDACKIRKVKCDTSDPCANCRIARYLCVYNILPQKRGRKNVRISLPIGEQQGNLKTIPKVQSLSLTSPTSPAISSSSRPESLSQLIGIVSLGHESTLEAWITINKVYEALSTAVGHTLLSGSLAGTVDICIDLFIQYLFPIIPIIHEPTLRDSVSLFQTDGQSRFWASGSVPSTTQPSILWSLRKFTLITALCACVLSVFPESPIEYHRSLATSFQKASRSMHEVYRDYDIENPDSSSLAIRMLQSRALQSITGNDGASFCCLLEAALIAQRLHLNLETSLRSKSVTESQRRKLLLNEVEAGFFKALLKNQ